MKLFNSAILQAPAGLVERGGGLRRLAIPVRYGVIEGAGATILVDTGYGPRVTSGDRSTALRIYAALLSPKLKPWYTGAFDTILVTHLHADHVARLKDFPTARPLASRDAIEAFTRMTDAQARRHGIFKELIPEDFSRRATAIESLPLVETETCLGLGHDLDGRHIVVPLPGHAIGHVGVFWRDAEGPVLYATDVAWTLAALRADRTPALSRAVIFDDAAAGRRTEARVRAFMAEGGRVLLCHDPIPNDPIEP